MNHSMNNKSLLITKIVLVAATVFLAFGFFVWTLFPNSQITRVHSAYRDALTLKSITPITENPSLFSPFTSAQPLLRHVFLVVLVEAYTDGNVDIPVKLMPFAIQKEEEVLPKTVPYMNAYLYLGNAYDILAITSTDPKAKADNFAKAEANYKKALEIIPNHQTVVKWYAISLFNRGDVPGAINLVKRSLSMDDSIAELHYFLGQFSLYAQKPDRVQVLNDLEFSLKVNINPNPKLTQKAYQDLLFYFAKKQDVPHTVTALERLMVIDKKQATLYGSIRDVIQKTGKVPELELNIPTQ